MVEYNNWTCTKCKGKDFTTSRSGSQIKISCEKCGAYLKFANKKERVAFGVQGFIPEDTEVETSSPDYQSDQFVELLLRFDALIYELKDINENLMNLEKTQRRY